MDAAASLPPLNAAAAFYARGFAAMLYRQRDELSREELAGLMVAVLVMALELGLVGSAELAAELEEVAAELRFGTPAGHA